MLERTQRKWGGRSDQASLKSYAKDQLVGHPLVGVIEGETQGIRAKPMDTGNGDSRIRVDAAHCSADGEAFEVGHSAVVLVIRTVLP